MKRRKPSSKSKTDWRFGLNAEKIGMWLNILGFILSVMFYIRMHGKLGANDKPIVISDPTRDSLIISETRLKVQVDELKTEQELLLRKINEQKKKILELSEHERKMRNDIRLGFRNEWDDLSLKQKEEYLNKTMSNLKNKQPNE